jgi:DNA-damage-inducible protein D
MTKDKIYPSETPALAVFKGCEIRKKLYNNEWWFAVNDVISVLTDSADPAQYFKRLKQRDPELSELFAKGGVQFVPPLMLEIETSEGSKKCIAGIPREFSD